MGDGNTLTMVILMPKHGMIVKEIPYLTQREININKTETKHRNSNQSLSYPELF